MSKRQNARKLNVSPSRHNQQRWKQEQLDAELIFLGCTSFDFSFYFILSKRMRIHISHYLQTLSRHIIIICQRYEWKVWLPRFVSWPMLICLWFNTIQLIAITLFFLYILNASKREVPKTFTKINENEEFRLKISVLFFISSFSTSSLASSVARAIYTVYIWWRLSEKMKIRGTEWEKIRWNRLEVKHNIA